MALDDYTFYWLAKKLSSASFLRKDNGLPESEFTEFSELAELKSVIHLTFWFEGFKFC
ncbi:hypothetical protein BegalDRAFT_1484 [Beggiatoa alba B18LD]|uniref:Uncharacterized protein n=1 Tax=Beggiatoa alba B18LD TaxID=395493 RepID=I3CFH8_9GAMM|nr:hypothetical protein BegalDRAFT_1484 [Beggiatoa alba B18LD]